MEPTKTTPTARRVFGAQTPFGDAGLEVVGIPLDIGRGGSDGSRRRTEELRDWCWCWYTDLCIRRTLRGREGSVLDRQLIVAVILES